MIDDPLEVAVIVLAVMYLMTGLAFAQLTWRGIDRDATSGGEYWRAIAALVLLWPKMLHDLRKRGP